MEVDILSQRRAATERGRVTRAQGWGSRSPLPTPRMSRLRGWRPESQAQSGICEPLGTPAPHVAGISREATANKEGRGGVSRTLSVNWWWHEKEKMY